MKLSRDAILFFMVETRNTEGVQPATLGSAYDSFKQLGIELRRLIRKYGKKKELEQLIGR
jgi:hypothetical protein